MRGIVAALGALLIMSGCASPSEPAPSSSAATRTMRSFSSTAPPPTSAIRKPTAELDQQFLTAITERGVPVDDPDEMTAAGYGVCVMLNDPGTEDRDLISASAWVMDVYEVPGKQAGIIASAGIDAYCPGLAP